jgi:hypothetical protein
MGQNAAFEVAAELPLDIGRHRATIPVSVAAKAKSSSSPTVRFEREG